MEKLKIIVGGNIGLYPTGGASWDYVQYPLGFKLMGHDVYYIEDTRQFPIFQPDKASWDDASYCVDYLASVMKRFGMHDRWAYRDIASGQSFGMSENKIIDICKDADVFVNVSCSTFMRDEYHRIPNRLLIDSDPMFTQIQYAKELSGESESELWTTRTMLENHNYLFTFGENINKPDCIIPKFHFNWIPTRQPICLQYWNNKNGNHHNGYSTVMNWSGRKKLSFNDDEWGQKDVEFVKYKSIPPQEPGIKFNAVINAPLNLESRLDLEELSSLGWNVLDTKTVADMDTYRDFIFNSAAEFSVAKETYVKSRSGWFSCRSACYLAASRPVITAETGWSDNIKSGEGLFAFHDIQSARDALHEVKSNYNHHSNAALEIAHEFFDSNAVLTKLLNVLD